jgi:TonB family protein
LRISVRGSKRWCTTVWLALMLGASLLSAGPAKCGDEKAAASLALLDRARTLEDLRADGSSPFVLHARMKYTNPKGQADGSYLLIWLSKNRWHEEVHFGDFSRVRDGVDGGYRQIRALDYDPQVIWDLAEMVDVEALTRLLLKESAEKPRNRKIDGRTLSCVEIRSADIKQKELCFDAATGLLAHATIARITGEQEIDYTQEAVIGTKQFPREMKSQRKGGFALELTVSDLTPASESTPLPVPDPARSEFWARCTDGTPLEITYKGLPHYPEISKRRGDEGRVIIYARFGADGTVSHLQLLSSPSPELGQAGMDAVAQIRFTPATCAGMPIRTEFLTGVVFALRP